MKHKTKRCALLLLIALLGALLSSCGPFLKRGDALYDPTENLLTSQADTDARILKELQNKNHTLDHPLVLENPYYISPLTAIILFQTKEETPIEMTINGKDPIVFQAATAHALPVYGLYADYDNEITLRDADGNSHTLTIRTEPYEGGVITVEENNVAPSEEFFLVSPDYECTSAYEADGRLLWYLDTPDNEGAVIFLGGDRFLISDPYQGVGGIRINYSGFMEMDYLGRIHKLFVGEYGYHHEIVPIRGGSEYLIPGHDEDSPYQQAVVYAVDADTMAITDLVDFYEVFHRLAPRWADSLLNDEGKFNFVVNGVDYDEASGDILVSVRSTAMIIRINLHTAQLKWIFADPEKVPYELRRYLLTPTDETRYPYGQHATEFLDNGCISYHNNDVDFMDTDLSLDAYRDRYSSSEILKIDEENKTLSTVWTYDDNRTIISRMSGSLEFLENGHTLLSYGSALDKSRYENASVSISDFSLTSGLMEELDETDQVIWKATFPGVIHKVYRSTFYGVDDYETGEVPNYTFSDFRWIDGQDKEKHLGEAYDIKPIRNDLMEAEPFTHDFYVRINRAIIHYAFDEKDEVNILFVNKDGEGRLFTYKESGSLPPIINSGMYGIRVNGLSGRQKVYLCISGKWYDTGKQYDFG